ncbi:Hypothetical protein I5071_9620 [Sandaracinus amylolyticus]|nr:Hypothetical protein I5071_9620 [Sandaracinus amylolyticus]
MIEQPGVAVPRPGFDLHASKVSSQRPRVLHWYKTQNIVASWDGSSTWAVENTSNTISGTAEPLDSLKSFVQFAEARDNLYWCAKDGVWKITNVVDTTAEQAGMHEATSGLFSIATVGAVAIPNNTVRAWRWCFTKRDANGLVVRSAPSPWQSYENTTGGTIDMNWIIALPNYVAAGDQIELYASQTVPSGDTPSDMMYLSKRYTVTSGDVTAGYATVKDARTDADLGAELYTNPTREGLLKANGRPPACGAVTRWSDCMWFGRTVGPWTSAIEIVSVTGSTSTDGLEGLQRLSLSGTATNGNPTLTGFASTTSVVVGQLVTDNGSPGSTGGTIPVGATVLGKTATTVTLSANATASGAVTARFHDVITVDGQAYYASGTTSSSSGLTYPTFGVYSGDPERTARELAFVISLTSSTVFGYAIEDPYSPTDVYGNATKGTLVVRSVALDDSQWAVTSTRDGALSYEVNASGGVLVSRDDRKNAVFYSKPGEPEHVPEINYITIGDEAEPIVAFAPLRAAMLVFKRDGVFRITGSPPDGWRVDLLEPTVRALRAECVAVMGSEAYVWAGDGMYVVDESGARNISDGAISQTLKPLAERAYVAALTTPWVATWSARGLVLIAAPTAFGTGAPSQVFCYSTHSRAWTRWTCSAYCAREAPSLGSMRIARGGSYWEIRASRNQYGSFVQADRSYTPSAWTYDASGPTVTLTPAQRGDWVPAACHWVQATIGGTIYYRRVTEAQLSGSDYVLTLETAFPVGAQSSLRALEGFEAVVEWQALTPGTPATTGLWSEVQGLFDWSTPLVAGGSVPSSARVEVGASANGTTAAETVTWTGAYEQTPTLIARVGTPRDVARSAHFYPHVSTCDLLIPWRLVGVAAVFEPVSQRTNR